MVRLVDPCGQSIRQRRLSQELSRSSLPLRGSPSLPGISIAVAYYGAVLLSERLHCRWRASISRRHRALRLSWPRPDVAQRAGIFRRIVAIELQHEAVSLIDSLIAQP